MRTEALFSSAHDHWETPDEIYDDLYAEFRFSLDPCPIEADFDGLALSWQGHTVYINPPYSDIEPWISKAYEESKNVDTVVVMLLPARTDMGWFHHYALKANEIRFIEGRLRFGGVQVNAPFPSMVVVFTNPIPGAFTLAP